MSREREELLELLKCGIWDRDVSTIKLDNDPNWGEIFKLASQQVTLGIITTKINLLPLNYLPSKQNLMKLHTLLTQNRQTRNHQIETLGRVLSKLREYGIERPVLLKGIGVGLNYPDPTSRQCGDLDIYVGESHFERARQMVEEWDECHYHGDPTSDKHFEFTIDKTPVEIHRKAVSFSHITRNCDQYIAWEIEQLEGEDLREVEINGVKVLLPPYNFDALYIFIHAWLHFCKSGIAWRQIADWTLFLANNRDSIDRERLSQDIKRFGFSSTWSHFISLAVTKLDLPEDAAPLYNPSKSWRTDMIADRVWSGGNFGYYGKNAIDHKRGRTSFTSKFRSIRFIFTIDVRYAFKLYSNLFFDIFKRK